MLFFSKFTSVAEHADTEISFKSSAKSLSGIRAASVERSGESSKSICGELTLAIMLFAEEVFLWKGLIGMQIIMGAFLEIV